MNAKEIKLSFDGKRFDHSILIGDGALAFCGEWARRCLGRDTSRIVIVSNQTVFSLYGNVVSKSLSDSGFTVSHFLIKDGERQKNFRNIEKTLASFSASGLTRTDAVIALGGGTVGDLAGFAASIYLRGLRFLQVPTTLLAMIDSSIGGKTGVNASFGKNVIGTFHQPFGVLTDPKVLTTLPRREFEAGMYEAVKHGIISGRTLFLQTREIIDERNEISFANASAAKFTDFLAAQIAYKAKIVQGDQWEDARNTGSKSRKILNFGHTFAHALERAFNYRTINHGEAVGYGILFASELSKKLGLLDEKVVNLLRGVVHRVGSLPSIQNVDPDLVFESFRFDKKRAGETLNWVMLAGIGKPVIVPHEKIPGRLIKKTLHEIITK